MTGNSQNQDGSRKGSPDPDPTPPQGQDSPSDLRRPQGDPEQSSNEELDTSAIQPHVRKLNLVGSSQITRAVAEAVRRGLSRQFVVTEAQIEEAVKAIGGELLKRLKKNSKAVRGLPKDAFLREVRADKQRIEAAREDARKELEMLLEKLKSCHDEVGRREAELVRKSHETSQVQDQLLSSRIAELLVDSESKDPQILREEITELALNSLQEERAKSIEAQLTGHRGEVQQFERRISKLTHSLELTEEELKRIAAAKNIEIGVGSIYRTVQGLSASDDKYETKKELMSSIFAANLELQKGHAEAG